MTYGLIRAAALSGAAAFAMWSAAAAAQTVGGAGSGAEDVPEKVIVTGRLEEDIPAHLAQYGTRVDTVTAAQIKDGGYIDIAQTLQTQVPGLYIAPKNGPFDYVDISLLGSRTPDVLWLVDGVRINNRLYAGTTPLDTLPASMVERVEVLEGPQALFYGTQGVAGAINVVTKDFSDTPNGAFTVGADTNSGRHVDGFFRDAIAGGHFVVYGSSDVSEGYQPFRDQDYQPSATDRNRGYNVLTLGGKYAYDFNPDLRLTVSEQHTDAKLDDAATQLVAEEYNQRNEDILTAKVDYTPSDRLQFFLKGYYHWWYAHFTEFDHELDADGAVTGDLATIDDHDFWGYTDYGLNALAKFQPTPMADIYLGYDYQNYSGKDVVLVIAQKTEHVHALFGEIATNHNFLADAQFSAGFRYNAPSVGPSATVWDVSGRWDILPDLFVKAMVGTAFRLPTAEELFANDPQDERGNPDLKPEQSTNVNGSIGGFFGNHRLRWELVGFYRDIDNLIDYDTFDAVTNQDVFGNVAGTVRMRGGEAILDASVTDEISANASFTFNDAQDSSHEQIDRVPKQLGKLTLDYHPSDLPFGLFATLNYVGDIYRTVGGVGRVGYGDYAVIDMSGRIFLDAERHHRFDLTIFNLFDTRYSTGPVRGLTDVGNTPYLAENLGLPRTFQVRYTYNFN